MPQPLPEEIKKARQLFAAFEKERDHKLRTRAFQDAVDILNDCLAGELRPEDKKLIGNLKKTYTRKLLEELPGLLTLDIFDWLKYIMCLMGVVEERFLCASENPQLENHVQKFIEVWEDEAIKLFKS